MDKEIKALIERNDSTDRELTRCREAHVKIVEHFYAEGLTDCRIMKDFSEEALHPSEGDEGAFQWNEKEKCLEINTNSEDVICQVGRESPE